MSGMYAYRCKCGKTFPTGYAFSSHRCRFKRNAGAYVGRKRTK